MQTVSPALNTAMNQTMVKALPEAIFEFDYSLMGHATVTAPEGLNEELFPKESVISQRFVGSGLPRAIVGMSRVQSQSSSVQYRVVDESDHYRYWVSPTPSGVFEMQDAWMEVWYDKARPTNKIYVCLDASFSHPRSVQIQVRIGSTWETVVERDSHVSGVFEYYPQANGSWSTTYNINNPKNVRAVRVQVNRMRSGEYAHFIAISARYRVDMSSKITKFDVNKNLENATPLAPIGDTSVNSCGLSLENEDRNLDPENENSPYYGLMSRNVRIDASTKVENLPPVKQGIFFSESWDYSAPSVELGVSCSDYSRFMQEIRLPPFTLIDYSVHDAVREVLQRAGFNIDEFRTTANPIIPYMWYNDEVSVWEALKDIANATMGYFYVDEDNNFIWTDFAYIKNMAEVDVLDADQNLISLDHNFDVVANKVNVEYNIYGSPTDEVSGEVITQELWGAGEDEALLSMALDKDLHKNDDEIYLMTDPDGFRLWPERGIVNIQGERIRYREKESRPAEGRRDYYILKNLDRGILGTNPKTHISRRMGNLDFSIGPKGRLEMSWDGALRIIPPSTNLSRHYNMVVFGTLQDQLNVYGTRLRFYNTSSYETGGLVINRQGDYGGIFVEISTTRQATRNKRDEIRVYRVGPNGGNTTYYTAGVPYDVAIQNWYDLEVYVEYTGDTPQYSVFVNGMFVVSFEESRSPWGRHGCYARGYSRVEFARVYAAKDVFASIGRRHYQDVTSGSSFSSNYVFDSGDPNISINEFSPRVRQVREFKVDFSKYPALSANVLSTNIWQTRPFLFTSSPFGAHFYLENVSDMTAVAHGESPNLFSEPMSMHLLVYGDPIIVASEENKEVKDAVSIRRNGAIELDVSNPWIQTDEMADNIADLIIENFAEPMDMVTAQVFPNYAYQLGDTVVVEYQEHGYISERYKYYVLGISTSWSNGFSQTLDLRRKR